MKKIPNSGDVAQMPGIKIPGIEIPRLKKTQIPGNSRWSENRKNPKPTENLKSFKNPIPKPTLVQQSFVLKFFLP